MSNALSPRYARVLFNIDSKNGRLDGRLEDFASIQEIFKSNPRWMLFLRSPQVALQDKKKALEKVLKEHFDARFINFLCYLIENRKLHQVEQIEKAYKLLVNKHFERWEADLLTAIPLDTASEVQLVEKLETMFHKKIHLNKQVDPTIIGGAVLIIANEILDWSVTGRLKKLKEHLIQAQV